MLRRCCADEPLFHGRLGPRSSDGVDLVRPAPKADRDVLERYITNKYVAKQFVRDMDPEDTVETLTQQLWEAMDNMDLPKAMQLLAWGASVQMRNGEEQGGALIHHVTRTSSSPVALEFTLLQGGEIDAQDDLGFSALHHAIALSKLKMAIVLLRRGASLHLRDVNGTTVMDVAEEKQDPSCLTLIRAISQGLMTVDQAEEMLVDTAAANESSAESMSDLVATNHVVVQEDHVAGHGSTDDGSDL